MEFLKFVKRDSWLSLDDASNVELWLLGGFLRDDVSCYGFKTYRGWFYNEEQDEIYANRTIVAKVGLANILIKDQLADEDEDFSLEIRKQEFIKILDEWEKICKEKPSEVMIIKEGDTYRFETKN